MHSYNRLWFVCHDFLRHWQISIGIQSSHAGIGSASASGRAASVSEFSGEVMDNDKGSTGQLTRQQICSGLGVGESTIRRLEQAGLPFTPVGECSHRYDPNACKE